MSGPILNMNGQRLLDALKAGDSKGYVLFPEIRDRGNIDRIKKHPATSRMLEELLQYAKKVVKDDIPELLFSRFVEFSRTGNRLHYENIYFESKKQLHALVMAELTEETGRYLGSIQDRLWKWCDTYSWELPAHVPLSPEAIERSGGNGADVTVALFSAETAFYFAEILSLLGGRLDPLLVYRLRGEIRRRILDTFAVRTFTWEKAINNWSSVCAGAVGCTAIYSLSDTGRLSEILLRVTDSMECFLSGFDNDGVTPEGLTYWSYGFSFLVYYSELLRERTCGEIDLLSCHKKLRRIAELPLSLHFPDGGMINFSDAPGSRWEGDFGLLCRLSRIYGIDGYRIPWNLSILHDHTSKWAITSRDLFWGVEQPFDGNPGDLEAKGKKLIAPLANVKTGTFYFPGSQWLIDRRIHRAGSEESCGQNATNGSDPESWNRNRFRAFAAKGGNNDESHNHNDLGHFILYSDGDTLLADLGAPEYTREYFSASRYSILHASSRGHSVPVINGMEQAAGTEYSAKVTECMEKDGVVHFGLDLTGAYAAAELNRFHRKYEWDGDRGELAIRDDFSFTQPGNTVREILITLIEPVPDGPGRIRLKGESSTAMVCFDADAQAEILREEFRDHHGRPSEAYRIQMGFASRTPELAVSLRISII